MDILIVKYYVCQNQSKNANFGLPKICFWPKNLSKADHFEVCQGGNIVLASLEKKAE